MIFVAVNNVFQPKQPMQKTNELSHDYTSYMNKATSKLSSINKINLCRVVPGKRYQDNWRKTLKWALHSQQGLPGEELLVQEATQA